MSVSTPFQSLPGAVLDEAGQCCLHFGAPLREQRDFAAGKAVIDAADLAVVTVTGSDRLRWLNSLTSQKLDTLAAGVSTESLLLSPQGRIEQQLFLVDDGETTWLIVDADHVESLVEFLNRMRFALRVEVATAPHLAVVVSAGGSTNAPSQATLATEQLAPHAVWQDPWEVVAEGGHQYAELHPAADGFSCRYTIVERERVSELAGLVRAGEIKAAGSMALAALQIAAARPTVKDIDDRTIPHEFDMLRTAVHLSKGCYRGQETVAKVHNLGHPPRRLVLLHIDGSGGELPQAGALVYPAAADFAEAGKAKPLGRVTRAVLHHELGPIAMALLKRGTAADAEFDVAVGDGFTRASQQVIVPIGAGATRDIPRFKRL